MIEELTLLKKKTHTHTIPQLVCEGGDEGGDTYGNDNDNNLIPRTGYTACVNPNRV